MPKTSRPTVAVVDEETPFARFTRNMRALFAVPKKELDAKLAAQKRRTRRAKA